MLSVVIPTFNRCETLRKALAAYSNQSALHCIQEIIIVDDGSTDSTQDVVSEFARRSPMAVHAFRQAHQGPAAARNCGIRAAKAETILFTDDDIIPSQTL